MSDDHSLSADDDTRSSEAIEQQYEWSSITPSAAVIKTLARAANCAQDELSPLYDPIDPEAFNAILVPHPTATTEPTASIPFTHTGYTVTVQNSGTVQVSPVSELS